MANHLGLSDPATTCAPSKKDHGKTYATCEWDHLWNDGL
jgi:hypothetical protein